MATRDVAVEPPSGTPAVVWVMLLAIAAAAWAATIFEARSMGGMSMSDVGAMTPAASTVWSFLAAWVLMMVAMMFPSAAPSVTALTAVHHDRRQPGRRPAPAWIFLVGYLTVWGLVGIGAYLVSLVVPDVRMTGLGLRATSPLAAGLVLIAAGSYQWSPFKRSCLERCRSAMAHFRWQAPTGAVGACRSGIAHATRCIGSSAGLMLVLFAVGLMNLGWMGLLTAAIFAENVVPFGPLAGRLFGAVLAVCGVVLLAAPQLGRFLA